MNVSIHVLDGVINNRVLKVTFQTIVGLQLIREDCATGLYVLAHLLLKFMLATVVHNLQANFTAALDHAHYGSLVFSACAGDFSSALGLVHVTRFLSYECLVNFYFTGQFSAGAEQF